MVKHIKNSEGHDCVFNIYFLFTVVTKARLPFWRLTECVQWTADCDRMLWLSLLQCPFFRMVQKSAEHLLKLFRTHPYLFFAWNIARRTEVIFIIFWRTLSNTSRCSFFCLYWIHLMTFRVRVHAVLIVSQWLVRYLFSERETLLEKFVEKN